MLIFKQKNCVKSRTMLIETMLTEESLYPQVLTFLFLPTDCSTKHFQGRIAKKNLNFGNHFQLSVLIDFCPVWSDFLTWNFALLLKLLRFY